MKILLIIFCLLLCGCDNRTPAQRRERYQRAAARYTEKAAFIEIEIQQMSKVLTECKSNTARSEIIDVILALQADQRYINALTSKARNRK